MKTQSCFILDENHTFQIRGCGTATCERTLRRTTQRRGGGARKSALIALCSMAGRNNNSTVKPRSINLQWERWGRVIDGPPPNNPTTRGVVVLEPSISAHHRQSSCDFSGSECYCHLRSMGRRFILASYSPHGVLYRPQRKVQVSALSIVLGKVDL